MLPYFRFFPRRSLFGFAVVWFGCGEDFHWRLLSRKNRSVQRSLQAGPVFVGWINFCSKFYQLSSKFEWMKCKKPSRRARPNVTLQGRIPVLRIAGQSAAASFRAWFQSAKRRQRGARAEITQLRPPAVGPKKWGPKKKFCFKGAAAIGIGFLMADPRSRDRGSENIQKKVRQGTTSLLNRPKCRTKKAAAKPAAAFDGRPSRIKNHLFGGRLNQAATAGRMGSR